MLRLILTLVMFGAVPHCAIAVTPEPASADDLLVVNCLLPGQLRQLGNRTTYMSARRPVRTTALDCRVRGGEYVLRDRANLKSAMKVWLQAARSGDAEAQTTLGEIFEQGLGVPPDYDAARRWYEMAAAQEDARALTNLGNLYERGLGVAQDPAMALQLYRRAAGLPADLPEAVVIDAAVDVVPVNAELQQALQALKQENADLQDALARSSAGLDQASEAQRLQLRDYEQALSARDEQITHLQDTLVSLRNEQADAEVLSRQLAELSATIDEQKASLQVTRARLSESDQTSQTLRDAMVRSERETEEKVDQIQQLVAEIERLRAEAATSSVQVAQQAPLAGPVVSIVDPVLPTTRGLIKVSIPTAQAREHTVIGRVTAPAGLLSLMVNDEPTQTNAAGVFTYKLRGASDVHIAAIDQQGKRADLRFAFSASPAAPAPQFTAPKLKLGKFHALLIGNSDYQYLPRLDTPDNDIDRLQQLLTQRYDFDVTVLRNANRYQMLSALNDLRARLTSDDNLLIYYAGHGELDRTNMRGHWLPVDAEPDSTANWISNVAITDILNVIGARQIMLVVDSCYSGTLTRSSLTNISTAMTDEERQTWLDIMADKRARVVLTSGGLAPVMDAGGGQHSVFASALLDVLEGNGDLLTGRSLYEAIAARVATNASRYDFEQIPAYAPIARSGHEAGDFILLPVRL